MASVPRLFLLWIDGQGAPHGGQGQFASLQHACTAELEAAVQKQGVVQVSRTGFGASKAVFMGPKASRRHSNICAGGTR